MLLITTVIQLLRMTVYCIVRTLTTTFSGGWTFGHETKIYLNMTATSYMTATRPELYFLSILKKSFVSQTSQSDHAGEGWHCIAGTKH